MCSRKLQNLFWTLLGTATILFSSIGCSGADEKENSVQISIQTDVMVPMRDGVCLATDIYRPVKDSSAAPEKLPVILMRTPYDKNTLKRFGLFYAKHGYAFVIQDTRGRFASEGVWHMLTDDGPDGVDCAAWIGRQPWSNAKIGMMGTSYDGGTQHAMSMAKAKELVTVIPVDAMSDMGRQSMRNGGAFELRFYNWIMLWVSDGSRAAKTNVLPALKRLTENRIHYMMALPVRKGLTPLKLAPEYEDWIVDAMRHGADDDFWDQNDILENPQEYKDIPVYLVGGWYDSWAGNTTANYCALSRTLKSPVYLIMGPWIHGKQDRSSHGEVTFGKDAAIPAPLAWRMKWFDHWLKESDNEVGKTDPFATKVRIFVMGSGDGKKLNGMLNHGGFWRNENEWPLARTQYTPFYFGTKGTLKKDKPYENSASAAFQFDPRNPVPTIGGCISSGEGILLQGAWNQRGGPHVWNWKKPLPLSARNDILVFQTEPLKEDIEVTGDIEVKFWASSSAKDTDFTAKLLDIYPPNPDFPGGFDLNIADGIIRARFRESLQYEKLMEPGKVYPFTIRMTPTSNVFKKGHRIRVDISSSNFPRFDINPNTGEALNDNRRTEIAVNTIRFGKEHPSHILLPVIPAKKENSTMLPEISDGRNSTPH